MLLIISETLVGNLAVMHEIAPWTLCPEKPSCTLMALSPMCWYWYDPWILNIIYINQIYWFSCVCVYVCVYIYGCAFVYVCIALWNFITCIDLWIFHCSQNIELSHEPQKPAYWLPCNNRIKFSLIFSVPFLSCLWTLASIHHQFPLPKCAHIHMFI